MDGVGSASAILAVAQVAWNVYKLCRKYYSEVKEARKEIQTLSLEVMLLADLLTNVSDLANDEDSVSFSNISLLGQQNGPLDQCRELLNTLKTQLDPGEGESKMRRYGKRALKWPFRNKDIENLLSRIGKHKETLNMALAADNM